MTFFYDLNKKLADLAKKQTLAESAEPVAERATGDYSAKKARAGKDIGKPGKMFSKIAKSAGERYGSKERGEKVAGAVLAKLRAKESVAEDAINDKKIPMAIEVLSKDLPVMAELGYDKKDIMCVKKFIAIAKSGSWQEARQFQKRCTSGASDFIDETLDKYRAWPDLGVEYGMEEGNEFSGELAKAKASGAKEFKVDGKTYPVKEGAKPDYIDLDRDGNKKETMRKAAMDARKKKMHEADPVGLEEKKKEPRSKGTAFDPETARGMFAHKSDSDRYDVKDTGYSKRYTRKPEPETDEPEVSDQPKKRGRPKGPDRGPERVTAKSYKYKAGRPAKTKEDLDTDGVMMTRPSNMSSEGVDPADHGEYDREGEMAKQQMHTIMSAAKRLHSMLGDDDNMPEWVQKKIILAKEYLDGVADYMASVRAERGEDGVVAEKAVSKAQRKAAGIAYAAAKGEIPRKELRGASKEMAKMAKGELKKFAKTKEKGLPEKVKEADAEAKPAKKGGFEFGKGVYENLDARLSQALTESMNISVNMAQDEHGEPRRSITVTADGDAAEQLAKMLQAAGLGAKSYKSVCPSCGSEPCGCEEELDENSPDWPTNTETSDDAMQYSGGLNGPKSTGQTTTPVIASQLRRQVSMPESVELERTLFRLYQNYKAK